MPSNSREALQIDRENDNTKWQDSMALEFMQLQEFGTFKDLGKDAAPPAGYQMIRMHYVYDVKHDLRLKSRLVCNGAMTQPLKEVSYSGVVSLRSLRLVVLLAELNGLELMQADVSNAYLEAYTSEKVYFRAGPEFGELQGHTMVVIKACYGLCSSGARWHDRFADTLCDLKFVPSKADPNVWMRENKEEGVWEYIATWVDDLAIACKDSAEIIRQLREVYNYGIKGDGPIEYHLGGNFDRDPDGTLAYSPKKYIQCMMDNYKTMFGELPKEQTSPLEKGDHPEMDMTEELDQDGIAKYQSLIGALQWLITLGRFDVAQAVMTMSRFRAAPRKGHLLRVQRIYGYVRKFDTAALRFRTGVPDYSHLPKQEYDWMYSVYGEVKEEEPHDMPKPLGKPVVTTMFVDANLYHDYLTGRSCTGILHLVNQTPIEAFSKRQSVCMTATFGSEFVAAKMATEQIIDLRTTLRYMGVPVKGPSYMFGDNQSVVTNSTIPHSTLQKRWYALAYHRVREAVAGDIIRFFHIEGKNNVADCLTKSLGYQQWWPLLHPILFWRGDTKDCT